jgi:hypothetical protein
LVNGKYGRSRVVFSDKWWWTVHRLPQRSGRLWWSMDREYRQRHRPRSASRSDAAR